MATKELSIYEMTNIEGGKPTEETEIGYDISWGIVTCVKWVVDLF